MKKRVYLLIFIISIMVFMAGCSLIHSVSSQDSINNGAMEDAEQNSLFPVSLEKIGEDSYSLKVNSDNVVAVVINGEVRNKLSGYLSFSKNGKFYVARTGEAFKKGEKIFLKGNELSLCRIVKKSDIEGYTDFSRTKTNEESILILPDRFVIYPDTIGKLEFETTTKPIINKKSILFDFYIDNENVTTYATAAFSEVVTVKKESMDFSSVMNGSKLFYSATPTNFSTHDFIMVLKAVGEGTTTITVDATIDKGISVENEKKDVIVYVKNPLGDFNDDGKIDLWDFYLFKEHFGSTDSEYKISPAVDLNNDGIRDVVSGEMTKDSTVNENDFAVFALNYGWNFYMYDENTPEVKVIKPERLEYVYPSSQVELEIYDKDNDYVEYTVLYATDTEFSTLLAKGWENGWVSDFQKFDYNASYTIKVKVSDFKSEEKVYSYTFNVIPQPPDLSLKIDDTQIENSAMISNVSLLPHFDIKPSYMGDWITIYATLLENDISFTVLATYTFYSTEVYNDSKDFEFDIHDYLSANSTYLVQIEAIDIEGSKTAFEASFTTTSPPQINLQQPQNGAVDVPVVTTLSWKGNDPDGDGISYYLHFQNVVYKTASESTTVKLEFGENYSWYVMAEDSKYASTASEEWSFTTVSSGLLLLYSDDNDILKYDYLIQGDSGINVNSYGEISVSPDAIKEYAFYAKMLYIATTQGLYRVDMTSVVSPSVEKINDGIFVDVGIYDGVMVAAQSDRVVVDGSEYDVDVSGNIVRAALDEASRLVLLVEEDGEYKIVYYDISSSQKVEESVNIDKDYSMLSMVKVSQGYYLIAGGSYGIVVCKYIDGGWNVSYNADVDLFVYSIKYYNGSIYDIEYNKIVERNPDDMSIVKSKDLDYLPSNITIAGGIIVLRKGSSEDYKLDAYNAGDFSEIPLNLDICSMIPQFLLLYQK